VDVPALRRRSTSVILCASSTLALALSACSSSGSSNTGSGSTGSAAATTSAAPAGTGSAAPSASSGGASAGLAAACTAAESEGQLNFRDTTDPDVFAKEVAGFEQKYPKIKVNFGSQRPQDSVQSVVAEVQAGHALDVDAISIDFPSAGPLIQQNLIATVDWPSLGVPESDVLTDQTAQFVRTQRTILGLGYNTTKLKASDLPDTWDQLIDSKWAGKIIVDPRGEYLSGLGIAWGEQKALDWYTNFMKTDKPMVVKGATASLQKVISGEAELTTSSHDAEILEQQAKGAPVDIKYLDVVPTQDHYAIILKGAQHPNAAKCFLGWWISPDGGQAAQLKYEFKGNETEPKGVPATAKLGAINSPDDAALQTKVASEFSKLTGGGS
jgi:iron(III) transport system substrate-binding protein